MHVSFQVLGTLASMEQIMYCRLRFLHVDRQAREINPLLPALSVFKGLTIASIFVFYPDLGQHA